MKLVRIDAHTKALVPDDDPRPALDAAPAEPEAAQAEPEAETEAEPEAAQAVKRARKS